MVPFTTILLLEGSSLVLDVVVGIDVSQQLVIICIAPSSSSLSSFSPSRRRRRRVMFLANVQRASVSAAEISGLARTSLTIFSP